jgi:ring-1,2-phenylacetyl-CoA epoxidase subunit PaaC
MRTETRDYILMLADSPMILGQRLGAWCGHGPVLEQDIALTNIALDLIGEARNYYHYLAETEGRNEDDYPMLRDVRAFKNVLLVEQPNGNWADTIMRQFMFDCYHHFLLEGLTTSNDLRLANIAKKSVKESAYHLAFSAEWVIRLGDGTDESHQKMRQSLDDLIVYFDELFIPTEYELYCSSVGIGPDLLLVKSKAQAKFKNTLIEATLDIPVKYYCKTGGKTGFHTEHLGFILAELQYLQRAYPGANW